MTFAFDVQKSIRSVVFLGETRTSPFLPENSPTPTYKWTLRLRVTPKHELRTTMLLLFRGVSSHSETDWGEVPHTHTHHTDRELPELPGNRRVFVHVSRQRGHCSVGRFLPSNWISRWLNCASTEGLVSFCFGRNW